MLTTADLITFVFATLAVLATPGVTVSALTGTTLSDGPAAGFAMEAGAMLGRLSMIIVLALGLNAVSQLMLAAFDWIKFLGAAYLIWIGIKTIRNPPTIATGSKTPPHSAKQILNGFIVLWSNPKALIFFGAFIPQFIDPTVSVGPQIAFLGMIWVVTALVTDSCYILLAGRARETFRGNSGKRIGFVAGAILIGAGIWLALQTKA